MVKNPPANAGDLGSIPGPGTKSLHAGQLSLCTLEPVLCKREATAARSPQATTRE